MGGAGIDARDLDAWLEPFLGAMGRKTRRGWAPLYLRGLLGPGERKTQFSQLISHDACKPLMLLGRRGAKSICGAKASGRGAGFAWLLRI
jgi:hypothetical protein